ncbi:hypothetical protein EDC96DRAFT_519841 [Choanephora cucurbitarum]|nr:hypothetical protein EDC96DRAFT_519841 [Choanephora cucurbitarum]
MRFDYFVYFICITILIIRLMKCQDMIRSLSLLSVYMSVKFFFPLSYSLTAHHFGKP